MSTYLYVLGRIYMDLKLLTKKYIDPKLQVYYEGDAGWIHFQRTEARGSLSSELASLLYILMKSKKYMTYCQLGDLANKLESKHNNLLDLQTGNHLH